MKTPLPISEAWIQVHSGGKFRLDIPASRDVRIDDIAHALAHLCRYTGHTKSFYSVAQHSVIVSHLVPPELALCGLLHDATEAYIGDLSRPLKALCPNYRGIEAMVWLAIAERFQLPQFMPHEVKRADNIALLTERRDLLGAGPDWGDWTKAFDPMPETIEPLGPHMARALFLNRYEDLTQ